MSRNPFAGSRRLVAGTASGALVASVLLLAAPAQAAGTEAVTLADIAPTDAAYAGWHQGAVNNGVPGKYDINSDGLTLVGRSQVIKGYANNDKTLDAKNLILSKLGDASYDVTRGAVAFQVPLFFDSSTKTGAFTTLRPAQDATGQDDIDLSDQWISSGDINGSVVKNVSYPLSTIIAAFDDYKTIGFGVYNQAGYSAVKSITLDGETYEFTEDAVAAKTVKDADVAPNASTYAGWHQGYDKAPARAAVTSRGLELAASNAARSQIINGYANNSDSLDTKNVDLAVTLQDAAYSVSQGNASLQVPLFFDENGTTRFATLRSGSTAGDVDLDDLWQTSRAIGSVPANTDTPVRDIIAALGDSYKVIAFGVQAQSNTIVTDITWDGTKYTFADAPAVATNVEIDETEIAPDATTYAGWHQGATNAGVPGKDQVTNDGLNLIGRSQVINGYANNSNELDAKNITLIDAIKGAAYTVDSGDATFQIPMFVKDTVSGTTKFTTLRFDSPGAGAKTLSILDTWQSSGSFNGIAANTPTQLSTILEAAKDYKVIAYGVFNTNGTSVVSDITWDGTKTSFVNTAPTAADVTGTTRTGDPVTVTLKGDDAETKAELVYSADEDTTSIVGDQLTYTPVTGFSGVDTFDYTVSDSRGGTATAEVSITVNANGAPTVADVTTSTPVGVNKTVSLVVTDPEGDEVTLATTTPGATIVGNQLTVTVPKSSIVDKVVTYTATDSKGASSTAKVTVDVVKAGTKTALVLSPAKPKPGQTVTGKLTVTSTASVTNGYVDVYVSGKKIATGRVTQDGKASVALGKAVKGTRTVVAKFRGTSLTNGSTSTSVRIINK